MLATIPPMFPEVVYAPTKDGWQLAMHHWPGRGPARRHPVLMVHGLGTNRLSLDMGERHSVAQAARDRGSDVFILELRGAGLRARECSTRSVNSHRRARRRR